MQIIETNWKWANGLSNRATTKYIVLHHAEASSCTAKQVDEWHKSNGWSGIGYHFFVRKDGSIYRGRPINKMGSHVLHHNNESIGICAEGAYSREYMPEIQKKSIAELLDFLKTNYYPNAQIVGHREIGSSDCPGKNYPLDELKNYKNIVSRKGDEIDMEELNALKSSVAALSERLESINATLTAEIEAVKASNVPMIYDYIDDNMPEWAKEGVKYCIDNGIIVGTGTGLGLTDADLKWCTIVMRMMKKN